jgi:hypothetical protein
MKKLSYILTAALLLASGTSCSDFLEVTPENSQTSDDYWRTEQDVENVLFGGYYYLRSSVESYLIPYGELRAGLIYSRSGSRLQTYQVTASNTSLCTWENFYKIINIANTVLQRADEACVSDATYTESERNSHYTEAYFLRALSYFYLVRNWRDVPMPLTAYEDDNVTINLPKSDEATVVAQIKDDIRAALATGAAKEAFSTTWETKGRATKWALYALMADVCLWSEDYQEAITYCDALLNASGTNPKAPALLSSPSRSSYFSIFNPGNSNESIFELQYNAEEQQTNNLPILFDDQLDGGIYRVSAQMCQDIVKEYTSVTGDEGDEGGSMLTAESPRTYHSAFYAGSSDAMSTALSVGYVWKYLGSTTEDKKRTTSYYDPNFIIYRMADIYLMKAEALLLVDGTEPTAEHKLEAVEMINRIRERAGLTDNIAAGMYDDPNDLEGALDEVDIYSQEELLQKVLDERKIEFLGEGKIWYDFLRMGRSNNNRYKSAFLVDEVTKYNSQASESWLRSVLNSDNALYLPIMSTEIDRNPLLVQNPYYK